MATGRLGMTIHPGEAAPNFARGFWRGCSGIQFWNNPELGARF